MLIARVLFVFRVHTTHHSQVDGIRLFNEVTDSSKMKLLKRSLVWWFESLKLLNNKTTSNNTLSIDTCTDNLKDIDNELPLVYIYCIAPFKARRRLKIVNFRIHSALYKHAASSRISICDYCFAFELLCGTMQGQTSSLWFLDNLVSETLMDKDTFNRPS